MTGEPEFLYEKNTGTDYPYELQQEVQIPVTGFTEFDHEFFSLKDNLLTLKKKYAIDGVTGWFDFPGLMPGAFVHDALLQAIGEGLASESLRDDTHPYFYRYALKKTRAQKISAWIAYRGLAALHDVWRSTVGRPAAPSPE